MHAQSRSGFTAIGVMTDVILVAAIAALLALCLALATNLRVLPGDGMFNWINASTQEVTIG